MPEIDLKRLRRDVKRLKDAKPADVGPGGHRLTGNKALVRAMLARLDAMKAEGATWVDIAAALAAQGVRQGHDEPITANRLTALVSAVRKEKRKTEQADAGRAARGDLAPAGSPAVESRSPRKDAKRLQLSPELTTSGLKVDPAPVTEEQIRRERFHKYDALFKKE